MKVVKSDEKVVGSFVGDDQHQELTLSQRRTVQSNQSLTTSDRLKLEKVNQLSGAPISAMFHRLLYALTVDELVTALKKYPSDEKQFSRQAQLVKLAKQISEDDLAEALELLSKMRKEVKK